MKNLDFTNYGYRKNKIIGEVFNQRFKIDIKDNYKNINFFIPKAGVFFKINILENDLRGNLLGSLEGKVLSSKVKLNFSYDTKALKLATYTLEIRKYL